MTAARTAPTWKLSLHDRKPHGLIVRMQLPVCREPRLAV